MGRLSRPFAVAITFVLFALGSVGCQHHHYYYGSNASVCDPVVMQPAAGGVCELPPRFQGLGGGLFNKRTVVVGQAQPLVTRAGRPGTVVVSQPIVSTARDGWRQPDPEENVASTATRVESGGFDETLK
jgi:hypothetical protein